MLSASPIKSANATSHYFEQDNYYLREQNDLFRSTWWGKGAAALNLGDTVNPNQFEALLRGELPHGQQLGRIQDGQVHHRPGFDLTFSAPKSVSILARHDERFIQAHLDAVKETLHDIENQFAAARITIDGKTDILQTKNLVIALHLHETSRALDPQIHTHCVVMNMTQRNDGVWRSLASQSPTKNINQDSNGFLENIFANQRYLGSYYRARLAFKIKELGYEIERTHSDGRFDLKGISKDICKHFSQRRENIEALMEEQGMEGARAASTVTLMTRPNKAHVDREVLYASWDERFQVIGFDPKQFVKNHSLEKDLQTAISKEELALNASRFAIQHLSAREAVFSNTKLKHHAISHALGNILPEDVDKSISKLSQNKELIPRPLEKTREQHWTTLDAIQCEKNIIQMMKEGQKQFEPITSLSAVEQILSNKSLTAGQQAAVTMITTTIDQFVGVQGYAGTGKTTMINVVKEISEKNNLQLFGVAPSAVAAKQLHDSTGIETSTLSKFLISASSKKNELANTIVILDESSMVGMKDMQNFFRIIKANQIRAILIGDTKQLNSPAAGQPFYQLQKANMQTAQMTEILRQKNDNLRLAVEDATRHDMQSALKRLDANILEISDKNERLNKVIEDYLTLTPEKRKQTLVLTPANADRVTINSGIREGLKNEGFLKQDSIQIHNLIRKDLTSAQTQFVNNFAEADIVRFNKNYRTLNIKKDEYYTVKQVDNEKKFLLLEGERGKSIKWYPEKIAGGREGVLEIYQRESKELSVNEQIKWTRNDSKTNRLNADLASVISIDENGAKIQLSNKKIISVDFSKFTNQHWDYAYVTTVFSSQSLTRGHCLIHDESFRQELTNQKSFYTGLSRAEHEVIFYVDDKQRYLEKLQNNLGEKTQALSDQAIRRETEKEIPKIEVSKESNLLGKTKNIIDKTRDMISGWLDQVIGDKPAINTEKQIDQNQIKKQHEFSLEKE